jgi:hypothetical protein
LGLVKTLYQPPGSNQKQPDDVYSSLLGKPGRAISKFLFKVYRGGFVAPERLLKF